MTNVAIQVTFNIFKIFKRINKNFRKILKIYILVPDHEVSSWNSLSHIKDYKFEHEIEFELLKDSKVKLLKVSDSLKSIIDN